MITFLDYINEEITLSGSDLSFLYSNNKDAKVSTSFGKDKKLSPFKKKINDDLFSYSLYISKDATEVLNAVKKTNLGSDSVKSFLNRSAIYGARVLRKHSPDIIVTPKSSSDLAKEFAKSIGKRTNYDLFVDSFEKNSDIGKIGIDEKNPKISDEIIKRMRTALRTAKKKGFLSIKAFLPHHRKFLTNLFELVDPKISSKVEGKTVVIVDDIMTSGTTANQISNILKNNGAEKVIVLTLFKAS
mgnify:CR=1 FL=1